MTVQDPTISGASSLQEALAALYERQLASWPMCRENYRALQQVETRRITMEGRDYLLQFNPARIRSASAVVTQGKVDRPCFLCRHRRPAEQIDLPYTDAESGHAYELSVNPYPIVSRHFTLLAAEHVPQALAGRVGDMARLAELLPDYLIFFNGACSGASAPDHFHFQAVPQSAVPLISWSEEQQAALGVEARMPQVTNSDLMNVACWTHREEDGTQSLHWLVIDRLQHRPWQYAATGEEQCLISPATLEFCGLVPLARPEDFRKMDTTLLSDIFKQLVRREPRLRVGVMEGKQIEYSVGGVRHTLRYLADQRIARDNGLPEVPEVWVWQSPFTLHSVTIGKEFHWEQCETQSFEGILRVVARDGRLIAINYVPIEAYLRSVIASEMSADNEVELLKTHAVISRSWVLRQMKNHSFSASSPVAVPQPAENTPERYIRWYDHDDHIHYDVCADDHCQRYQGLGRVATPQVDAAIDATRGEVLMDAAGHICDARFSKCCGGVSERFETCWQEEPHSYLRPIVDAPTDAEAVSVEIGDSASLSDPVQALALHTEEGARRWIERGDPRSFCNTSDPKVLRQVLNSYDRTTHDFYRWEVSYTRTELSELVERKMHWGLGEIIDLQPLHRGASGRIDELKIVGTRSSRTVGKELVIRKALSESHLYSSAFVVDRQGDTFRLRGAGWGHGVGLCQIGAACMSLQGYSYQAILQHYFRGATLHRIY